VRCRRLPDMKCSPEEYARSITNHTSITCLDTEDSIGITVTAEAGLLSLIAILYIFLVIAHNVRKRIRNDPNASLRILHQPMDILMASLLIGDILQAIGIVLSLKWVHDGKVEIGSFCNAQGIIKIFGATGVALSTLAIAVYTFLGIWVTANFSMRFTYGLVLAIWSFIGLLVAVSTTVNRNQDVSFMGPTPYWCWVSNRLAWRMAVEYLWMWLTLFLSILIYIPLYLWMRGNIIIDQAAWWKFNISRHVDPAAWARRRQAMVMLAYPLVYCLCILPLSAVRWKNFVQNIVFPGATFFAASIFGLSGFLNVILLLKTRPSTRLFDQMMLLQPARPPDVIEVEEVDMGLGRLPPERGGR